ncbi:vesicle-associated membrane protein 3-like [Lithobates pipiens]
MRSLSSIRDPDSRHAAVQTVTSLHGYKQLQHRCRRAADTAEDMSSSTVRGSAPSEPSSDFYSYQRMELTQAQIDEVVNIMNANVDKVLDRNGKINQLEATAEELHAGAKQFQTNTSELRSRPLWKNLKMLVAVGLLGITMVIVIIGLSLK